MANLNWVNIGNGYLSLGHIPGGRITYNFLKKERTSVVLTLLQEHEGVKNIGERVNSIGIKWIWFPFSASNPHTGKEKPWEVFELFQLFSELLETGNRIFIHCSAGIHRTGMITYGLLGYIGKGKHEALEILRELRAITAKGAGEKHLKWGDQFFNKTGH